MAEFFEYDPVTGLRTDLAWSEVDQQMTVVRTADDEALLNYTRANQNEGGLNRKGIAESWWLYAKLSPIVILQMRAKGINVYDKNDEARMFAEINSNYPHLKMTTGQHGGKEKIVVG